MSQAFNPVLNVLVIFYGLLKTPSRQTVMPNSKDVVLGIWQDNDGFHKAFSVRFL